MEEEREFGGTGLWKGNHRVEMLLHGEIPGVLEARLGGLDGESRLLYETDGFLSIAEWCRTRELRERDLQWILRGVLDVLREGEAFLLLPGSFFLTPSRIYLRPSEQKVKLCVRPEGEGDWKEELRQTGRFFLEAIDYKEEECVKLAYEFYHVGKREDLKPEDFRELLNQKKERILADDGETGMGSKDAEIRRGEGGWIQIEAVGTEMLLPEMQGKTRKEEQHKRWIRGILAGIAVIVLMFILYQSGF